MNSIRIKRLYLNDDIDIFFNQGENYIVGMNNTGKTTLFDLIQYIFGIKKSISRVFQTIESPFLECEINNKNIRIYRNLNSTEIYFKGDMEFSTSVNSNNLNDVYTDLMNIDYFSNERSSLEILKTSFLSEVNLG